MSLWPHDAEPSTPVEPTRGNPRESAQRFAATHEGVRRGRLWLQQELKRLALDGGRIAGTCMSTAELCANLVDHASPQPVDFRIALRRSPGRLRIEIAAFSRSFSAPRQFRQLLMAEHTDILSVRGRGMSMVGHYFPSARYLPPASDDRPERFWLELMLP